MERVRGGGGGSAADAEVVVEEEEEKNKEEEEEEGRSSSDLELLELVFVDALKELRQEELQEPVELPEVVLEGRPCQHDAALALFGDASQPGSKSKRGQRRVNPRAQRRGLVVKGREGGAAAPTEVWEGKGCCGAAMEGRGCRCLVSSRVAAAPVGPRSTPVLEGMGLLKGRLHPSARELLDCVCVCDRVCV